MKKWIQKILCKLSIGCAGHIEHEKDAQGIWWVGLRCWSCGKLCSPFKSTFQDKKLTTEQIIERHNLALKRKGVEGTSTVAITGPHGVMILANISDADAVLHYCTKYGLSVEPSVRISKTDEIEIQDSAT